MGLARSDFIHLREGSRFQKRQAYDTIERLIPSCPWLAEPETSGILFVHHYSTELCEMVDSLSEAGLWASCFNSGEEAAQFFEAIYLLRNDYHLPKLVITELRASGLNGIQTMTRIRQLDLEYTVPMAMLLEPNEVALFERLGEKFMQSMSLFTRPINSQDLVQRICTLLK